MFERKNIARIWGTAKIGLVLVFVWLTNTGFMERLDLLLSQGRYRASFLFIALWCFCVTCLLLVAFQKQARWRFFWAVVIAVTTFFGYAFMRISDSQLTVYHVFSLWTARADAERAASFYTDQIIIAAAVALFGFIFLAARPPRFAPLLEKYISALRFAPAVPLAALVLMITVRIGDDTAAMPQQFVPAAIGFVAGAKLMVHEPPRKAALARSPTRQAAARHIVLIVAGRWGVTSRSGGPWVPDPFARRGAREPAPEAADDDGSAPPAAVPPRVIVSTPDPSVSISGQLEIGLIVEDEDSSEVTVYVFFGHDSPEAADSPATLVEAAGESFEVVTGPAPMQVQHGITWDTHSDVPTLADSVYLLLCPIDAEGNEGECTQYPAGDGIRVTNFVIGDATGAFCSPGVIET
ncbi:MAG: hypothetical protein H8E30_07460, partial [Alphaproteobacteria bacterium]|nr:hypothetical protein [Alphaproteobacteria bacterium]